MAEPWPCEVPVVFDQSAAVELHGALPPAGRAAGAGRPAADNAEGHMSDLEGWTVQEEGGLASTTGRPAGISRRRFVAWGAAGLAAQWLALPARAATLAGLGLSADEPISVGYLDGSEQLDWLDFLPWEYDREDWRWRIVPASTLPSGDPALAVTGVRVTIHGLYPRPAEDEVGVLPMAAYLTVLYDPELPGERPYVHYAWGLSRRPGLSVGHRVSFVAPVHREDGLSLAMEVEETPQVGLPPTDSGGGRRRVASASGVPGRRLLRNAGLTVGAEDLRPRLVRGIYFLGLSSGAFATAVDAPRPGAPASPRLRSLVVSVEPVAEPW